MGSDVESEPWLSNSLIALAIGAQLLARKPGHVASRDLATFVVSVGLWSLREIGAADFSVSNPVRWLPVSSLMIGLRNTEVTADSIERELLNQVRVILSGNRYREDHRVKVRELVREWLIDSTALAPTVGDPYNEVLELALNQAKRAGADLGTLHTAGVHLADRWQRFTRDEPELATRLQRTVSDAIYSAVERYGGD